jgi:hypothetical protein
MHNRVMVMPVEESWRRIVIWLAEHAPVTAAAIRPAAGVAEEGYLETAWAGTAAMLADIADRLDDPTWTQVVDGGVLQWARSR